MLKSSLQPAGPAMWDNARAQNWVTLQPALERELAPIGEAAIEVLAPQPGEAFLDVGCGCGHATLSLARAAGPDGRVTGADIAVPMLDSARRQAAAQGLQNLDFIEADAQTYAFPPEHFDGLFSRFGVMFFHDPIAAFANLHKALKPGGRLTFVCWRDRPQSQWFEMPLQAACRHIPQPAPPGEGPGAFSFADPQRIRAILTKAGFSGIGIEPLDLTTGGGSVDEVLSILKIGFVGGHIDQFPDKAPAAWDDVRKALESHETPDGIFLGAATWIVSARK